MIKYSEEWWDVEVSCGICGKLHPRHERQEVVDCHGIHYKYVCSDACVVEAESHLVFYPVSEIGDDY
jgi:hypothetical protein